MTSSFRKYPYRTQNFAIDGVVPEYFSRPGWLQKNPTTFLNPPNEPWAPLPPQDPPASNPFPEPLLKRPPLDVDPSEQNPYNDPDHNPNFLVTDQLLERERIESPGGLLGLLQEAMQRSKFQPDAISDGYVQDASSVGAQLPSIPTRPERRLVRRKIGK
ncbi:MAG: hypothetical protein PS018_21850 [bacterium]|nr:hypothetical protein [bacterium]